MDMSMPIQPPTHPFPFHTTTCLIAVIQLPIHPFPFHATTCLIAVMAPRAVALLDLPPPQKLAGQVPQRPFVRPALGVRKEEGGVDEEGVEEAEAPQVAVQGVAHEVRGGFRQPPEQLGL